MTTLGEFQRIGHERRMQRAGPPKANKVKLRLSWPRIIDISLMGPVVRATAMLMIPSAISMAPMPSSAASLAMASSAEARDNRMSWPSAVVAQPAGNEVGVRQSGREAAAPVGGRPWK